MRLERMWQHWAAAEADPTGPAHLNQAAPHVPPNAIDDQAGGGGGAVPPGAITDIGGTPDKTVTPGAITDQAGLHHRAVPPGAITDEATGSQQAHED